MPDTLAFGEYRPDVMDLGQSLTAAIKNVLPRADGYGPFPSLAAFTQALPAQCRGYFCARKTSDNSVVIFAATATRLYLLDNTTLAWTDVSKGATDYSTLNVDAQWTFCQFNNFVIACQANTVPQKFNITSDSAFSDVAGSPPQAAYCTTINRFVVLSGLTSYPNRVQWSGLNDITNWTSGTGSSDFQDLPDGGIARGVVGGELGVIIQDAAIRTMTFAPGSDVIFNIYKVAKDIGCIAPYSITNIGNRIFFLSAMGWVQTDTSGAINFIGQEKIDRTFLADYDSGSPQLVLGAADPKANIFLAFYKSLGASASYCDKAIAFNYLLQRWAPLAANVEYVTNAVKPGLTLEALDAIAPGAVKITGAANNGSGKVRLTVASTTGMTTGDERTISQVGGTTEANGTWTITVVDGTHIDLLAVNFVNAYTSGGVVAGFMDQMTTPLDALTSNVSAALAGVDTTHALGFFNGPNLEATFETPEQDGQGMRFYVSGFRPITDAPSLYGSLGYRETLSAVRNYTPEQAMSQWGFVGARRSTRYVRMKMRIPSGTSWTFCAGLQPEAQADGYA